LSKDAPFVLEFRKNKEGFKVDFETFFSVRLIFDKGLRKNSLKRQFYPFGIRIYSKEDEAERAQISEGLDGFAGRNKPAVSENWKQNCLFR